MDVHKSFSEYQNCNPPKLVQMGTVAAELEDCEISAEDHGNVDRSIEYDTLQDT